MARAQRGDVEFLDGEGVGDDGYMSSAGNGAFARFVGEPRTYGHEIKAWDAVVELYFAASDPGRKLRRAACKAVDEGALPTRSVGGECAAFSGMVAYAGQRPHVVHGPDDAFACGGNVGYAVD